MDRRSTVALAALAIGGLVLGFRLFGPETRRPSAHPAAAVAGSSKAPAASGAHREGPRAVAAPAGGEPAPLLGAMSHTADPCTAVTDRPVPDGYETLATQGITVAWPAGDAVVSEPTVLAYLTAGLLEEAARITATPRREQLTVIVYGSEEEFRALSGAPAWASGLYDGTVKLPPGGDLGVRMRSLRHEVMHAQLHAAVGCMPVWFNEGVATQFAKEPPRKAWIRMLRQHRVIDLARMEVPTVEEVGSADVDAIYAQSVAMVLAMDDPPSDEALPRVIAALRQLPPRSPLWPRLRPGAGAGELLDALAQRVFGVARGPELDAIFQGAVCCYGSGNIADFGCRGAPIEPGKSLWFDESRKPRALCDLD